MRDIAVPALYRRNAFRLSGLPTQATGRAVRERRQKAVTAVSFGGYEQPDAEWALPEAPDEAQIRGAFEALSDPPRRIVDELLWFWGDDTACRCPSTLHAQHDAAIRAHAKALDAELSDSPLWTEAAEHWSTVLRRGAFWSHIRHRINVLDDPRLNDEAVDALRDELPRTLVRPVFLLALGSDHPRRLLSRATDWDLGERVVDDLVEETIATDLEQLTKDLKRAGDALDAGNLEDSAEKLQDAILPTLRQVERIASHDDNRGVARVREKVAVLFNNCALAIVEKGAYGGRELATNLFHTAEELAIEPDTSETIARNMRQSAVPHTGPMSATDKIGCGVGVLAFAAIVGLVVAVIMGANGNEAGWTVGGWSCGVLVFLGIVAMIVEKIEGL
jgi:hypothetical protein